MRIGIDLGGTKIEAVVLGDENEELHRKRVSTPKGDYKGTLTAIQGLVKDIQKNLPQTQNLPVGIGIPGAVSKRTGLVKNSNSVVLIGKPLEQDLKKVLKRPVKLANDANCFALSEATDGAAKDAVIAFGVILGTGVGGGVVVKGQVLSGCNSITGEWGHNALPWPKPEQGELPGPPCYCGKQGCIEMFLAGPALAKEYESVTGQKTIPTDIEHKANQGDEKANEILVRYEKRLARALASVINFLDPDVIVLGGGLSRMTRLYTNVPRNWAHYVFSDDIQTKLVQAVHGDSSGVRGAAWLWPNNVAKS